MNFFSLKTQPLILSTVLFIFLFDACSNNKKGKGEIAGGPCRYEDKIYPAKLVRLEMNPDSITWNAWLEIDDPTGDGKDTISYFRMTNRGITYAELKKDKIASGNIYKYVVSTLITGDCSPDLRKIILEKY